MSKEWNKFFVEFRRRLKLIRKLRRLSQTAAAERCKLSPGTFAHYESGRRLPTLENLVQICEGLRVSADYLLQKLYSQSGRDKIQGYEEMDVLTQDEWEFLSMVRKALLARHKKEIKELKQNSAKTTDTFGAHLNLISRTQNPH